MSNACDVQTPPPAKGWPEKIALWTIIAFLVGLPAALEILVALKGGVG